MSYVCRSIMKRCSSVSCSSFVSANRAAFKTPSPCWSFSDGSPSAHPPSRYHDGSTHLTSRRHFSTYEPIAESPSVRVAVIATYIYSQINGTYDDIYQQLIDLACNILEHPNDGSLTNVTLSEAKMMIVDVGACPGDFDGFLATHDETESSIAVPAEPDLRHPWQTRELGDDVDLKVPTQDLLDRIDNEPDLQMYYTGEKWSAKGKEGYMVYAKHGPPPRQFKVNVQYMKRKPVDLQFNRWFQSHLPEGYN